MSCSPVVPADLQARGGEDGPLPQWSVYQPSSAKALFGEPHANPVDLLAAYPWPPVEPVNVSVALVLIPRIVPLYGADDEVASHVLLVTVGQEDAVAVVAKAPWYSLQRGSSAVMCSMSVMSCSPVGVLRCTLQTEPETAIMLLSQTFCYNSLDYRL